MAQPLRGRFALLLLLVSLVGCGPSIQEISKQVTESMQTKLSSDPNFIELHLVVNSVTLVHANGNVYEGIAKITSGGTTHDVSVKVTADGKDMIWQTDPGAFLVFYGNGTTGLSPSIPLEKPESLEEKAIRLVRRDYDIRPEQPSSFHGGSWSAAEVDSYGQNYSAISVIYAVPETEIRCQWLLTFPESDSRGYSMAKMNNAAQAIFYSVPIGSHGNS